MLRVFSTFLEHSSDRYQSSFGVILGIYNRNCLSFVAMVSVSTVENSFTLTAYDDPSTDRWLTHIFYLIVRRLVDKKPMGWKDAPQTWLAAILCLAGVATLELFDSSGTDFTSMSLSNFGTGDVLSIVQAFGFGTGCYMSERMMRDEPDQALPITAGLIATTAFIAMIWCFTDGWMQQDGWQSMGLPGLFFDPSMRTVALAVLWTGVVSTSTNFSIEITALGRVPSSEASVILATEPLWASLLAALMFHEHFGTNDYIGGVLMISACLVNTLKPADINGLYAAPVSQDILSDDD